jgi:uncharacterized protein involved in exopolysaccharide biosynthesis
MADGDSSKMVSGGRDDSPPRLTGKPPDAAVDTVSVLQIATALLRQRRLVVCFALGLIVLVAIVTLVMPRSYTAATSFIPRPSEVGSSRFAGVAAQLGLGNLGSDPAQSPAFYGDLLRTDEILRQLVLTEFAVRVREGVRRGNLVEWFEVKGSTPERRTERAIRKLRERMSVSVRRETGLVRVSVTSHWAALSRQVTERMLLLVQSFNVDRMQSQAAAERQFVEARLEEAGKALRGAENELRDFLQENRGFESSSELRFQYERLMRNVSMRQQVYTSLAQSLEQAKIEEVRNTPVITVVDEPRDPARPDRRRLLLKSVLALVFGATLGAFVGLGREFAFGKRANVWKEYAEFRIERKALAAELKRPWRLLGLRGGRGSSVASGE